MGYGTDRPRFETLGYNAGGLEYDPLGLGLGCHYLPLSGVPGNGTDATLHATRESEVVAPFDMIAFTEAFWRVSMARRILDVGYGPGSLSNNSGPLRPPRDGWHWGGPPAPRGAVEHGFL